MLSCDDSPTGVPRPNSCSECASSCFARNSPKLNVATDTAAPVANKTAPSTSRAFRVYMSPPWSKSKIEQGGHYRRNEGILWQINDVFVTGAAWGPDENKETTAKVVY